MRLPLLDELENLTDLVDWWYRGFSARYASRDRMRDRLARHLLAHLGELECEQLTPQVLEALLAHLEARGLGPQVLNHVRSDLRRCIRAAQGCRLWHGDDPTAYVKPRPVPRQVRRVLSLDECRALLWGAAPQHLALFATALYAGLRKGELIALRIEDVDLELRRLYVRRSRRRDTTKTGAPRVVSVSDELAEYLRLQLETYRGLSAFVFPGRDAVGPRTVDAKLSRAANSALRRGGARPGIRFQDLRHTCTTQLRRAGVPGDLVGLLLGHGARSVTDGYTHWSEADLLDAVNKLALGAPRRTT